MQISKYQHDSSPHYDDQPSQANMDNVSELFQLSQAQLSTAYWLCIGIYFKGSNAAQVTKSNVIMSKVENDEAAPVAE